MIATVLLNFLYSFLGVILGLIPVTVQVPSQWISAINTIWGYINAFSFILPVQTLLSVLAIAIAWHIGVFLFHMMTWIIRKIPGIT